MNCFQSPFSHRSVGCLALLVIFSILSSVPSLACTTVVVSAKASATGRPLLWKNRDTDKEYSHIVYFKGERYHFTGLVDSEDATQKVWAGANEAGFCIVNNLSYNLRPSSYDGKPTNAGLLMKEALGSCATVEEFADFINANKGRGVSANFGVIDAQGGAAYFEVWDNGCTRYDASETSEGYIARTNYSVSGRPDDGKGYARFETATALLKGHPSAGISAQWLIDKVGRSFYNAVSDKDLLKGSGSVMEGDERIPRFTSTSSIVFEGAGKGDKPSSTVMWTALGYSPCAYIVPVWIAAGDDIPSILAASSMTDNGYKVSAADSLAMAFKRRVYLQSTLSRDAKGKYIDVSLLKKVLPYVRKAEKTECKAASELDSRFRASGFDLVAVRKYNEDVAIRFNLYRKNISSKFGL
jgi:hypothetical protein